MWGIVLVSFLLRFNGVLGRSDVPDAQVEKKRADFPPEVRKPSHRLTAGSDEEKIDRLGEFINDTRKYWERDLRADDLLPADLNEGRGHRLRYKRAELRFLMKALLTTKVILGVILPFGIIASKILSWKAVTLSLMAFMLAKILFVKNLLTGKNAFSVTPTNFVPPVVIQGGPNDLFWKRQGDSQNAYPWNS